MIHHVCGTCHQYERTEIIFNEVNGNFEDITSAPDELMHLNMPIKILPQEPTSGEGWKLLPLVEVPGFVLVMRKPSTDTYTVFLKSSVLGCWPAFAVMFAMYLTFGLATWTVVSEALTPSSSKISQLILLTVWHKFLMVSIKRISIENLLDQHSIDILRKILSWFPWGQQVIYLHHLYILANVLWVMCFLAPFHFKWHWLCNVRYIISTSWGWWSWP